MFDRVVAENGAVIYDPTSGGEAVLAPPPPPGFVEKLIARNVEPISVGHSVVATWEPHQTAILETIKELGLELKIVFNKGAVMVLPPGVTKASGLEAALAELDISSRNVVGIGDAENDHAFLQTCGCAAAMANALPAIKAKADVTLAGDHGVGVAELIQHIIDDDERLMFSTRLGLPSGTDREGHKVYLMPHQNILVIGDPGCGKSRFAKMLTERMVEKEFEFCVIDPEGDYHGLQHSVATADGSTTPRTEAALRLLQETGVNVVVNTVVLSLADRQRLVSEILVPISGLKARTGRPHWIIVDEAHQIFPAARGASLKLPHVFPAAIFITVSPESLSGDILKKIDAVIALAGPALTSSGVFVIHLGFQRGYKTQNFTATKLWFGSATGTARYFHSTLSLRANFIVGTRESTPSATSENGTVFIFAGLTTRSTCVPRTFASSSTLFADWTMRPGNIT